MATTVGIVDYACGNLRSLQRALLAVGADDVRLISDPREFATRSHLVLPGVGAFGPAIRALDRNGMINALRDYATSGRPLLGVCLGMQLLFEESEEFGHHRGLGLIPGRVVMLDRVRAQKCGEKIPHIGWNRIVPPNSMDRWQHGILDAVNPGEYAYFVHSYETRPADPDDVMGVADFAGAPFCAVTQRANVAGCQFHPEKSATTGLRILSSFLSRAFWPKTQPESIVDPNFQAIKLSYLRQSRRFIA